MRPTTRRGWLSLTANQKDTVMLFFNRKGRVRTESEKIIERAFARSPEEIARCEELKLILIDGLNSLEARLEDLSDEERKAVEGLLYQELAEVVFDFRISLETRFARQRIQAASSREDKQAVVDDLRLIFQDIEMLHGKT